VEERARAQPRRTHTSCEGVGRGGGARVGITSGGKPNFAAVEIRAVNVSVVWRPPHSLREHLRHDGRFRPDCIACGPDGSAPDTVVLLVRQLAAAWISPFCADRLRVLVSLPAASLVAPATAVYPSIATCAHISSLNPPPPSRRASLPETSAAAQTYQPSPPSNPASFLQTVAAPAPASSGLPPSHPPPPHVPMSYFCPKGYHLCNPNKRQPLHFCDVDVDCWGDVDYCHTFNSVCREQRGCCVVPAVRSFLPPSPPPLPPAPPAPLVPVCPEHTHLCAPNGRQKGIFCDVDRDCYGDMDYCRASPACQAKKGCCIQQPKVAPMPKGWLPPLSGDPQLSPAVCERLLRDPGHLFRRMWGVHSRHQNHKGDPACWSRARDADWVSQLPEQYFEDIFSGRYCQLTDWYDGSPFAHGIFRRAAPALLGFDADILGFCNGNCDGANANILALFGNHVKYNTCRNLEWQMCAVRGMLDWQDSKEIMFARAPKTVSMDGVPPFGHCSGYTDAPCNDWEGFANDDIFYLEVCLFSMLCKNSDELFKLNVGERFICDFSEEGFSLLQQLLLEGPES